MRRPITRRVFVHRLGFVGGGVVLLNGACTKEPATPQPAAKPPAPAPLTTSHRTFTDVDYAILSAACDRILPKDQDPGALEANVPEYIDRILQTEPLTKMREDFVPGLQALDRRARRLFKVGFTEATVEQRDEVLTVFKNSPEKSGEARWYELLVVLSLEGFLGDPSYGGNKDKVGWRLVGFDLVGSATADPRPSYDGVKHLHALTCGGGKGC